MDSYPGEEHREGPFERFKRKENGYDWVNLGDVDWAAAREAFRDIGCAGSAITELNGGDEAYLRDVSRRVDRLIVGRA